MLSVPPALLEVLDLHVGETVSIAVDSGRLIIEPQKKARYTLEALLAQCDPSAEVSGEDREWFDAAPTGDELL